MKLGLLYIIGLSLLVFSCGTDIVEIQDNTKGNLTFSIDKINAPENIVGVSLYLTRKNFETRTAMLNLASDTSATISVNNIKIGIWHLKINALDNSYNTLYSGETDVEIIANTVTPVSLQLKPVLGNRLVLVKQSHKSFFIKKSNLETK